jgi:pilus assembly protein FimV
MFRKTGIGLAALAMLAPGLASALGVGDYTLNSYLNQPLDMEVQLFDAGDLTPEEVLANLGSERDFQGAGVERVFFLNELSFEVVLRPDGNGTLRIRSEQPVREPFLNFIVELMWPTGRLLREYTVLLDPPTMAESVERQTVAPVASQQAPAPVAAPVEAPVEQIAAPAAASQPRVVAQSQSYDSSRRPDYVVQPADTMWRIALNNRPVNSISVQQMLMAIQQLNPGAFIDGNVNLVREGTVLRMPSEQEIRQVSTRDALVQVAEQNREWRAKLEARGIAVPSRTQLDGTATGRRRADSARASEGQVTLVSPDAVSGTGTGRGTGGRGAVDASALQNELAIRDENVDRLSRQNDELASRLKDLQEQVATSEQLLKLRNDQIAQLQQQLRKLQEAQGVTPAEPVVVEPVVEAPVEAGAAEGSTDATGASEAGEAADAAADETFATEDTAATEPVQAEPVVTAPVRPVPPPAPVAEPGIVDMLMANLLYIAGALLALVLVVGGMAWMRNRQQAAHSDDELDEQSDDVEGDDDFFASGQDFADDEEPESESVAAESAQDPLEEVDVYTAYGRHAEAVNFLRNEIRKAPKREDLKVRLLEVLAEMHDRDGFEREASNFARAGSAVAAAISSLRARFPGAAELEPSLDDLEMDLASDFEAPVKKSAPAPVVEEELEMDLGGDDFGSLDFSLDDDKTVAAPPVQLEEELSLEDDGLSLDLDDGLSLDMGDDSADELTLELEAGEEELSLSLDDVPAPRASVALDDINADMSDDNDFGELSLDDMSDEFSETAVKPSAEEIDLSLDDLSFDEEPTQVSKPVPAPAATVQRDALELDELLLDDAATSARPALEPALEHALTGDDDDFDFLGDTDENATKLDLAKAYIDMGDSEGARDILQEVMSEGNPQQQQEAKQLLAQVG